MSIIYSDRHQRYIDTDFENEEDYDEEETCGAMDRF